LGPAALAFVFVAMLAHSLWLPVAGRFLVVADPLQPADAVVPLGGGGVGRVAQAAAFLKEGYATWFVATDAEIDLPGIRLSHSELVRQEAQWQGVPAERILMAPGLVETTYEEALAVRDLAQEQGWSSLLVVTDPYHTRRASFTFRDVFRGTGVTVGVRPVEDAEYDPEAWWRSADGLRDTWAEYGKLASYLLGYR
jgi:uncharacterized SAM-binding protein YcdF (DUF218 family)